jgi:DNA repair protein RecN (Recombination protein N)
LHGQHEHQALLDPASHLPLVDDAGGLGVLAASVAEAWQSMRALRDQRDRLRMDGRERAARLDLMTFQLGEIDRAAPRPGEDEELASARQVLANAERIQRLCEEAYAALYETDMAVLSGLGQVWKRVGELAAFEPEFASHMEAREGIKSQLEDLALSLRRYADGIDASPGRLQQIEDRLALLERLKRKYGPGLQAVIDTAASLRHEHALLTGSDEASADIEQALGVATSRYLELAGDLSRRRRATAGAFAARVESHLATRLFNVLRLAHPVHAPVVRCVLRPVPILRPEPAPDERQSTHNSDAMKGRTGRSTRLACRRNVA